MANDTIALVNRCSVLTDAQIKAVISAVEVGVADFASMWGIGANLTFVGSGEPDPTGALWPLYIQDHTDDPGTGGYHEDELSRIIDIVFAADSIAAGDPWTIDATHELFEMLGDPTAGTDPSKYVALQGVYAGYHCLREVCDACEDSSLAYQQTVPDPGIDVPGCARSNGKLLVPISDFVLPQYFFENWVASPRWPAGGSFFDFMGHLTGAAPTLLPGGYLGEELPDGQWSEWSAFDRHGDRSRRSTKRISRTKFAVKRAMGRW